MKQIHYITYNDSYSGIYQSQVIDVVTHLNAQFDVSVSLIAFIPIKLWKTQKEIIKSKLPSARVFPILGALDKISRTSFFFNFISNKDTAICRGPLAFVLTNDNYKKTIYDGRAAVAAEVTEYNVTGSSKLDELFIKSENIAINKADYFISVSKKLVEYWEEKLSRSIPLEKYSIIPCTLTSQKIEAINHVVSDKIRVVYSGGTGAWQSFEKVVNLLDKLMTEQSNVEALFLTKGNVFLEKLIQKYPDRCERKWLDHSEVYNTLSNCDYGILLREDKVTNRVASPVKFAEYLNAGLKVLISPNIGDFSSFTLEHDCGVIVGNEISNLGKPSWDDKSKAKELCKKYYLKSSKNNKAGYEKLLMFK